MPREIDEAFHLAGASLFPEREEDLVTGCTCPDWANPCKHIAAVYYAMADAFDKDPFVIFQLPPMPDVPPPLAGRMTLGVRFVWTGEPEEGARLLNAAGVRFMASRHKLAELAPSLVVPEPRRSSASLLGRGADADRGVGEDRARLGDRRTDRDRKDDAA